MVKAKVLANYLVKAYEDFTDSSFDNSELRLHKLMYFVQREALAIDGTPIIDDSFEGWVHGPVIPDLRAFFTEGGLQEDFDESEIGEREKYIVANVLDQYAKYAPWTLREMTHDEISWKNSRVGLDDDERGSKKILIEDIKLDAMNVRIYDHNWGMYLDEFEDEPDTTAFN